MDTAKLFFSGRSQAVRLPKKYRFEGQEVYLKRFGNALVLLPYDAPWQTLVDSLDLFSDDYMVSRDQPPIETKENPFQ